MKSISKKSVINLTDFFYNLYYYLKRENNALYIVTFNLTEY